MANRAFPRSIERGLIEARLAVVATLEAVPFPRSIERGLIEAWSPSCAGSCDESFRVQLNAASLKLNQIDTNSTSAQLSAFN